MEYTNLSFNDFDSFFELMEETFPVEERRSFDNAKKIFTQYPFYHVLGTKNEKGKVISFLAYWEFDGCYFVDHLAVHHTLRGQGIGADLMHCFLKNTDKLVVLEVELPENETARRRIKFYERLGFHLNLHEYIQPSMQEGQPSIKMNIMSYKKMLTKKAFDDFCKEVYSKAYGK